MGFLGTRVMDLATVGELITLFLSAVFFIVVATYAPISFVMQLLYFILAGFLGTYLIWSVEPALFSPLMSTSNSLSGVVILGGIVMASAPMGSATSILAVIAVAVELSMSLEVLLYHIVCCLCLRKSRIVGVRIYI